MPALPLVTLLGQSFGTYKRFIKLLCRFYDVTEGEILLNGVNIKEYDYDENGIEPSGGESQKIAIARALYKNAPIVILDEPTAALDPIAEYEIYNHFDQLVGGKMAVYISHRLSSCKFCDKIAVFADETVAEYGTHDELLKIQDGIYAEMFLAQAQYYRSHPPTSSYIPMGSSLL